MGARACRSAIDKLGLTKKLHHVKTDGYAMLYRMSEISNVEV